MKKIFIVLIFAAALTACDDLFHIGTHKDTIVAFTFVDANGKDIFADSLSVDDFDITSSKG